MYGGGIFVTGTQSSGVNGIQTSNDNGLTWTARTCTINTTKRGLAYGKGRFVFAAGDDLIYSETAPTDSNVGDEGIVQSLIARGDTVIESDKITINTSKTPSSATDTGVEGEICWDANYVYVCVATNTWKRSAIGTW